MHPDAGERSLGPLHQERMPSTVANAMARGQRMLGPMKLCEFLCQTDFVSK